VLGLRDRVALVTGGSSGIGEACARRLCDEGAIVVVAGRDAARTRAVAASLSDDDRASHVLGDVIRVADCARIVAETLDRHGRLDILVNSAGVWLEKPILETGEDDWDLCLDTNLKGAFFVMKAALAHMVTRRRGVIVNIASDSGLHGEPGAGVYSAAKAGLIMLTRSLAIDHGPDGIRLVCVSPGVVATPMLDKAIAGSADPAAYAAVQADPYPLGRVGRPEEIAAVVAFLASDEAGWITGVSWSVDGGVTA
jgi:NAD(P)-dependent dehydrogenase (short-subunit alcohol dehydrogenase family)